MPDGLRGQTLPEKDRRGKHRAALDPHSPPKKMDKSRKAAKKTVQLFSNMNRGIIGESEEEDFY